MHENHFMLTEILKNRFGFEGFLIGDWNAHEQVKGSPYEQVVNCFNAGLDMFMCGNPNTDTPVYEALLNAVKSGDVSMERLDDAVSRILTVKFKLGLFDNNRYPDGDSIEKIGSKEHRDVARQAVRESLVLLKNKDNIINDLKNMKNIFVAGKNADDIGNQSGGWTITWQGSSGDTTDGTTILEGIRKNVKEGVNVKYNKEGIGSAGYDVAIVVLGETPYAEGEGDAKDASRLNLDETDITCLNNIRKENPSIPIVVILVSGRPMLVADYIDDWKALIAAWLPGTEGDGVAEVLFDEDYDFVGKTSFAWPMTFNDIDNNPVLGQKKKVNNLFEMWYGLSK
jgi:beta-glucosidase